MSFLGSSNIEYLRRKRYGVDSVVRLLKSGPGGYIIIHTLTKNWFLGRQFDTQTGAYVTKLTFDRPVGVTPTTIRDWIFTDVVNPEGFFERYRLSAETRPNTLEKRWVTQHSAAFNDTTPVVGVITPVPIPVPPGAFLNVFAPFVHTQNSPATEWVVNHNLGWWPTTEIRTTGGEEIGADVTNVTLNQLRVNFAIPTAGSVRCV